MYGTVRTVVWEGGGRDTSVTRRALPDFHETRGDRGGRRAEAPMDRPEARWLSLRRARTAEGRRSSTRGGSGAARDAYAGLSRGV